MENKFMLNNKIKILLFTMMAIGLITIILGLLNSNIQGYRFWANLHLNNYYFLALSLGGVFFVSVHLMGESGWHTSIQRIPESMGSFIPFAGILMLVTFIFGSHELFHWTHKEHLDPILEEKSAYLNLPFFYVRFFVYFIIWTTLSYLLRKTSIQTDHDNDPKYLKKQKILASFFVVFFAISSSTSSWDWLMSIDPHWFSTLYGWYIFSGLLVSTISVIILIQLFLNKQGYMKHVNNEHLHDLGIYLFAFSILWAYLWFSQFMLIWYGNIPEETVYYFERLQNHSTLFYLNLALNFVLPFFILMTRNSKRIRWILLIAALIVFIGHWLDYFLAIMPGILGDHLNIGLYEIGITVGYIGLFLFIVFNKLTKISLIPLNHPYFKESLEYHTNY